MSTPKQLLNELYESLDHFDTLLKTLACALKNSNTAFVYRDDVESLQYDLGKTDITFHTIFKQFRAKRVRTEVVGTYSEEPRHNGKS